MPNRVAGRYELYEAVGEGRQGRIFRAVDLWTREEVALKLLHRPVLEEAVKAAAGLRHPNLASIIDLGIEPGGAYVALEYVRGPRIGDLLRAGGQHAVRGVFADVCLGLHYAHGHGIRHGDIKPDHILVESLAGGVFRGRITDFGFCRAARGAAEAFAGTVAYAAPEVLRGETVDHRADLYSVGAALYEALTGAPPFGGPDARAIADAHLTRPPPDPRQANPALSDEVCALIAALLAKAPSQRPSSAAETAARLVAKGTPLWVGEPAYVPRTRAVGLLAAIEARAAQGRGGVALVCGGAGSGKSTLLRELKLDAGIRGRQRICLSCSHLPDGRSAAEELLRRSLMTAGDGDGTAAPSLPDGELPRRLVEAWRALARDGPVIVVLDDMDAADDDFLHFVHRLCPQLALERVLLVGAVQPEGLTRLLKVAPGLLGLPHLRRLALRAFTGEETRRMIASLLAWPQPDAVLAAVIHRAAGGNPALACEATRLLVEKGSLTQQWGTWVVPDPIPTAFLDTGPNLIASRLEVLRPQERVVLGVLAVLGAGAPDDMLAEAAAQPREVVEPAVEALEARGLIMRREGRWIMRHGMLEGLARAGLSDEESRAVHTRAAAYLESRDPGGQEWAEPLARHLMGAGLEEPARRVALEGADRARRAGRHGRAGALYDLACGGEGCPVDEMASLALWGHAQCLVALGQWPLAASKLAVLLHPARAAFLPPEELLPARMAFARALAADGRHDRAAEVVGELLNETGPESDRRADALAAAALVAAEGRDWARAEESARQCLEEMPEDADLSSRARVENTMGVALMMRGRTDDSLEFFTSSLRHREALGDVIDAGRCELNLALATRQLGRLDEAKDYGERARQRFMEAGAVAWQAQAANALGLALLHSGAARKAASLFEESFRLATASERARTPGSALNNLGMALKAQGEWNAARERFQEAYRMGRLRRDRTLTTRAANNLGDFWAALGEADEARRWYLEGKALAEKARNACSAGLAELGLVWVDRERGALEDAQRHLDAALGLLEHGGDSRALVFAQSELSKLRLAQGRPEEALEAAERAARIADMGTAERAMVFRVQGEALAAMGRAENARDAFGQCLELLESTELAYGLALARLSIGRWLATQGPVAPFRAAERYLAQARDAFRAMGAERRVAEIDAELDRVAAAPGITPAVGADARKLALLYRMLSLANAPGASADALERILDLAVHAVHAQRGLVILVDKGGENLAVRAQVDIDGATIADARRISLSVIRRVAGGGGPVFSADALGDSRFSGYESIRLHRIACFMCVPLVLRGDTIGTIYLDSCSLEHRFTNDDVEFLQAFADHAAIAMENLLHREELEKENLSLQEALKATHSFDAIVGRSPAMQAVFRTMAAVASSSVTVLIQGATGTGKELVARAIHYNGRRSGARFVAVNCAAFPEALLESELFGHVRGAFTGATRATQGLFHAADGGTMFLDEVADMSPGLQSKVLRVLETGEVRRIGDPETSHVDARIICATNRDLGAEIAAGRFREDLYYRIRVVSIHVPPLRQRPQDIPLLVRHFLKTYRARLGSSVKGLSEDALALLCSREWPGNVRELEHTVEAAVALCQGRRITTDTLALALGDPAPEPGGAHPRRSLAETRGAVERHCIAQALKAASWNVSAASRKLDMDRRQLQRKMQRYGFRPARARG